MKASILIISLMLSGCVLRGGISAHNPETDTYFRGAPMLGTVSFTEDVPDTNIEVYVQHKSLLWENPETNCLGVDTNCKIGGAGLNEVGVNLKFDLY